MFLWLTQPHRLRSTQAAGRIDLVGTPADIYSLGATLYYILTGRPSVSGKTMADVLKAVQTGDIKTPSDILRGIPKSLEAVCLKAMSLKPEARYAPAQEMAQDIECWLADEPVSVYNESKIDRISRWLRRNRAWSRAVTRAAIAIIVVLSLAIVLINGQRNVADQQRQLVVKLAAEKSDLAELETELRKAAQHSEASQLIMRSRRFRWLRQRDSRFRLNSARWRRHKRCNYSQSRRLRRLDN